MSHRDIVCGKEIETEAFHSDHGDRPYYFCSHRCQSDFARNPLKYTDKSNSVSSTAGAPALDEEGVIKRSRW